VVPDPTGALGFGSPPEEAVREIGDATKAGIVACRTAGDPVPGWRKGASDQTPEAPRGGAAAADRLDPGELPSWRKAERSARGRNPVWRDLEDGEVAS
jgi:hypothetical protein